MPKKKPAEPQPSPAASAPPKKKKRAAPKHNPTEENRLHVQNAKIVGLTEEQTAFVMGIDPKTLRKHYRDELDNAKAFCNFEVAKNLYRMATGTGREALSAAIFWMKTQAGWSEYAPKPPAQPDKPGKKAQQHAAAMEGEEGTPWAGLVN